MAVRLCFSRERFRRMKLWALRLVLFLVVLAPLLVWGVAFLPGLFYYVMPLLAIPIALTIVRRFEFWLVEQGFLRNREPPSPRAERLATRGSDRG